MSLYKINPTSLAQYIRFECCDRFLRFRLHRDEEKTYLEKWNLTAQPLTPLLQDLGLSFEKSVIQQIAQQGEDVINLEDNTEEEFIQKLIEIKKPTIILQPSLKAQFDNLECSGRADAIRVDPDRQGKLKLLIADIKSARIERMEHGLQVAIYTKMIDQMLTNNPIKIDTISGAVLTQQINGTIPALTATTPMIELDTYYSIFDRLAVFPDSKLHEIDTQPFENLFYHLNYKCDGCLYNNFCMYDSVERLDIALTTNISAVEKRVLVENGIKTLPQLAALMDYPTDNSGQMIPNPRFQSQIDILRNRWPVAPNLPFLVQKAKAVLKNFEKSINAKTYLLDSGFGSLPSDESNPELIKIFFDVQNDYIKNRLYLLSAIVSGPNGIKEITHITEHSPSEEDEKKLLRTWIVDILSAIKQVAAQKDAYIHLYCYNRYDQKVLLESLKRNLQTISTVPAFFDLLTQSPALSQPIISFLFDELKERTNLGLTCLSLHSASSQLGFKWNDQEYDYFNLFRARIFDNRRYVIRDSNGKITNKTAPLAIDHPRRTLIESASRFNSQIPLEYAYAAWNELPELKNNRQILNPFKNVNLPALTAFANMRVKALVHIENWFRFKNNYVKKIYFNIPSLTADTFKPDLRLALEEFLFMEHHSSFQEHLLNFSLPVDRRVQSGRALLLKFNFKKDQEHYVFQPEYSSLGLDPVLTMNACKIKEGDWVVMNNYTESGLSANKIKSGRLAVIEVITPSRVILRFMDNIQRRNKLFCYNHNTTIAPEINNFYVLDEMADDLNADKILEALRNIRSNTLFSWLIDLPSQKYLTDSAFFQKFNNQIDALLKSRRRKLTSSQRKIIGDSSQYSIALVQGPPGTGKSYTLAWVILARIAAAYVKNHTSRVAVCCKTHNAIMVVLKALAGAKQQLSSFGLTQLGGDVIRSLKIYKISNDDINSGISGVININPYLQKHMLPTILNDKFSIIGATSGGLFNLMRYSSVGGKHVDWDHKQFDLIVIDEASQMSIPEGVLAGAFLKNTGQMIVVGDHRQMPPINAHPWKDEEKRNIVETRPYLSLFESFFERGVSRFALDESFRLHIDIAEFLSENIYQKDGIKFFSKKTDLVTPLPPIDSYVDSVMDPSYPIIVIEHTEQASQQFNQTELELTKPIINACVQFMGLDGRNGIGVVVPHRAQRALLNQTFPSLADVRSIDTVERFQGDERDVIIVSATASDPDYVLNEADFLLNLNRLNVAISRPRKKLIVIASRSVIDLLTSDLDIFENSILWKRLYYHYATDLLYQSSKNGYQVFVKGRKTRN